MTTSPHPIPPPDSPLIDATVTALTCRSTALGNRIYAVFNAVDGSVLGYWDHAEHPILRSLNLGDTIKLRRKANGHLTLAHPPVDRANSGPFAVLQRLWRLL